MSNDEKNEYYYVVVFMEDTAGPRTDKLLILKVTAKTEKEVHQILENCKFLVGIDIDNGLSLAINTSKISHIVIGKWAELRDKISKQREKQQM